jgi:propionyl-CoA carboxylase alpha chain
MGWLRAAVSRSGGSAAAAVVVGRHYHHLHCQVGATLVAKSLVGRSLCCHYFSSTTTTTMAASEAAAAAAAPPQQQQQQRRPFEKVLIANRGEIVSRVIRTCRKLDIPTVAIYSTGDSTLSQFVRDADERICIGPAQANLSYLNANNVLQAIQQSGATAVHPGYGFFSENANFCQQVQDLSLSQKDAFNGKSHVTWLGPPPHAIRDMGDKLASKDIAVQAGVSIVPGHNKPVESLDEALALCSDAFPDNGLKYPVLLKAAAGGGGKGMRTCYNEQDLRDAWTVSKAESLNFFNDDRLLLEKYIEKPHHVEFQVLAYPKLDGNGSEIGTEVVVFPERECSIQRRNQKVLEESPSPLITKETRAKMAEQVQRLCQATRYESAGTVEFLVDDVTQEFYFLEMNTRLQVEHPVTEAVCGPQVDLVKAMLYIGAGWGLPPEMEALRDGHLIMPYNGHALEARIYAEDPLRGYLPSTGPLVPYVEPIQTFDAVHGNHDVTQSYTRIDSGVAPGHVVTPHYDPMISKVVAYGRDRAACFREMEQSLDEYVIGAGSGSGATTIQHNVRLVRSVLRQPAFQEGNTPTSFLPAHYPKGFHGVVLTAQEKHEFAVAAVRVLEQVRKSVGQQHAAALAGSKKSTDAGVVMVRLGGLLLDGPGYKVQLVEGGKRAIVSAMPSTEADGDNDSSDKVEKGEESSLGEVTISLDEPVVYEPHRHLARVSLNGTPRSIQVLYQDQATGETRLQMYGADFSVLVQSPREYELSKHYKKAAKTWIAASNLGELLYVRSPMPGRLVSLAQRVAPNVEVIEGQELCIVEAMKMQNIIRSPRTGVIKSIKVKEGASLATDQIIFEFEALDNAVVSDEGDKKEAA